MSLTQRQAQMLKRHPCSVCDYVFTLAIGFAYAGILWWCDIPWWVIVIVVHWQTASWFLETRK